MNTPYSPTPPASPLAMPTQILSQRPDTRRVGPATSTWLARWLTFGGTLALTIAASREMYLIIPLNEAVNASSPGAPGLTALLWLLLGLFTLTFGWISLSATAAIAGLLSGRSRYLANPDAALRGKTVLLMPIYNEDPASACAALAAMAEELSDRGLQEHFEIFILSDTNSPDILAAETATVRCLQNRLSGTMPVWYRRREQNTERKAGNIRDFISRWGNGYDYMVVLDADSLITGNTLATLVREMDADPATGLLQTLPRQYGGETLFARLQQFAAMAYGPVFARGLCAWQGDGGNYWGHNAIVRIRAFAASAGLPTLPGRRPFGGEIRSHDFVEAALICRAGWSVRMLPDLAGSWEECPPSLQDAAIRDRRWAQGNVQHLAVVPARGLRWPNRVHMLMGVMNYLTSLLWLAMVTVGLVLSTRFAWQQQPGSVAEFIVPMFNSERMVGLFMLTMFLLLLPKLLGLAAGLLNRRRLGETGRLTFFVSAMLELLFSVLHAPIFMLIHSRHLCEIALGRDSGWSAQQRQCTRLPWQHFLLRHGLHTALGLLVLTLLLWLGSSLLYWMLPTVIGLILAIPLSALSGSKVAGRWLARGGLLGIPEEQTPPNIMKRRLKLLDTYRAATFSRQNGV
ncbi:glucans biosynthesis glucosyltransferase MdoH [Saccharospirillum impatiens]|uniref:glucans biosynthesis glucosyltransferase MdoH n=1 Tax=Saccharospirillum impatiens TaxID=169438 RepID=UPI0004061625|nr:glucans biosynthesis glucosyltransferase MdoH [Saccharospirillum impatiens]